MKYLKVFEKFDYSKNPYVDLLIDLTKITVPSSQENIIYDIIKSKCNKNLSTDEYGNLFVKIGKSRNLFTAHLDTFSKSIENVKHVIEDGFLKTDETTILGGDNKVGCCVIISMINNNIPGTYYFFVQEEIGRLGSEYLNSTIEEDQYDFCVAFDRKEISKIITHQRGIKLCNDKLSDYLVEEYSKSGYKFTKDPTGLSCDSYSFRNKIKNCLNISTGTYDEHKFTERVDINFFTKLVETTLKMDWGMVESLSKIKERSNLVISDLQIQDDVLSETVQYFINKGYFPNCIPKYDVPFRVYKSKLFSINPKIADKFSVSIKTDGNIEVEGLILTKEQFTIYMSEFKKLLKEIIIDNTKYYIVDIYSGGFSFLLNDNVTDIDFNNKDTEYEKLLSYMTKEIKKSRILKGLIL
jgi:hypothetical protein